MKIHIAGSYPGGVRRSADFFSVANEYQRNILLNYPYYLESYHYIGWKTKLLEEIREEKRQIFLDSGAFSGFTQGVEIDLEKYCRFIKEYGDIIEVASVLDGIGDPVLTLENQKKMEDLGVNPLPCFHYGEPTHFLEHYIENYDHITLGGMVPISTGPLREWLDDIWDRFLTDENGMPKLKVHGFGLTVLSLMERYPWYSVDSTSWVLTGRFGSIYFPTEGNPNMKLTISDQSPKNKDFDAHYDSMAPAQQEAVRQRIEDWGFDVEELRSVYWMRDLWNIKFFHSLCDKPVQPFFREQVGLFG